jgi:nitric oxide synthase oxygenase domain/subunit
MFAQSSQARNPRECILERGAITLLDILRAYAEAYVKGATALAGLHGQIFYTAAQNSDYDVRNDSQLLGRLETHLSDLVEHCQHLPMTAIAASKLLAIINNSALMSTWQRQQANHVLQDATLQVTIRLEEELAIRLLFQLPQEQQKYFETPTDEWEEVIARFPDTINNIEEMSKCFALSRFSAAVYHACQVIELGLIELGKFLEVSDPKSGFTAVTRELKKLIDKGHSNLPPKYRDCFDFLEQMHGLIEALKSAWRNKIDHAQKTLVLMTVDFTPAVAQEIMLASRAFMRRLATEMP